MHKKSGNRYSPEEDAFIIQWAGKKSVGEISILLGRSFSSIKSRGKALQVRFGKPPVVDADDIRLMHQLREDGMLLREIAEKFDISTAYACKLCGSYGIAYLKKGL